MHFRMFADSDTRVLSWCRWTEKREWAGPAPRKDTDRKVTWRTLESPFWFLVRDADS